MIQLKTFSTVCSFVMLVVCFSCATSKVAVNPIGEWNVTVTGTPYGEMAGKLVVSGSPKAWKASLRIQGEDITMDRYSHDGKTGESTGAFFFQGNSVTYTGKQSGASLAGTMSAGGMDFPFKGTRGN